MATTITFRPRLKLSYRIGFRLRIDGGALCWGGNRQAQFGNAKKDDSSRPLVVFRRKSGVVAVAAGHHHTCFMFESGNVKCAGWNLWGQIGDGSKGDFVLSPREAVGLGESGQSTAP